MNIDRKFYRSPVIYIILFLLLTVFIFSNSFKSGEESNEQSAPLVSFVERIFDPYDDIPTEDFNFFVRKAAHIAEFTLIGLALGGQLCCVNRLTGRWHIAAGLLVGISTAVLDEFIQSFTGRTSSVSDVLIDFIGVVIGIGSVMLIRKWKNGERQSMQ